MCLYVHVCISMCFHACVLHIVVCQLESSAKWPEDLEAIRMVKVAFYIHMAKALTEGSNKVLASPTKEYLDILKVFIVVVVVLLFVSVGRDIKALQLTMMTCYNTII